MGAPTPRYARPPWGDFDDRVTASAAAQGYPLIGWAVIVASQQPLTGARGAAAALRVLDASPNVVAVLSGHTHRHRIAPRRTPAGGYWIIETASLTDHPQQTRVVRLVRTRGGGRALETWVVDHDGRGLAGIARELAHLDVQGGRPRGLQATRRDRNARLNLPGGP